jgi:hypothetical protein
MNGFTVNADNVQAFLMDLMQIGLHRYLVTKCAKLAMEHPFDHSSWWGGGYSQDGR